mmetsp:Transcript_25300/g.50665  ORF Transcript_25300/g.50665 Transcript_25300/m.50665 type:complete len:92 (-) Transcript_25300:122-397(-)
MLILFAGAHFFDSMMAEERRRSHLVCSKIMMSTATVANGSFDRSFKVECDAPVRITPTPRHVAVPFISPHYIIHVPSTTPDLIDILACLER